MAWAGLSWMTRCRAWDGMDGPEGGLKSGDLGPGLSEHLVGS